MRISANVAAVRAGGASVDRRGRIIATKAKASNKNQIPTFRISLRSIDIRNPMFV
jgi:hypothetical protein